MKLEDYRKYYIQGSDHYLIPKDEFVELLNEMINWKKETKELKKQLNYVRNGEYHKQLRFENEMLQQVVDTNGVPSEVYDYLECLHMNTELIKENNRLNEQLQQANDTLDTYNELIDNLNKKIDIMERYFELIIDLGFDYDGLSKSDDLKTLIDELVHYARLGRRDN